MRNTGTLKVETSGDTGIVLTRVFDAPRHLVFRALTEPELLKRWFGPHGWTLVECDVDLRAGGAWRYTLEGPDERRMTMLGVFHEIHAPERLVYTESFVEYPAEGEAVITAVLTEQNGVTTLRVTSRAPSKEIRDMVLRSGMEHGAAETYDRLAALLPELA